MSNYVDGYMSHNTLSVKYKVKPLDEVSQTAELIK